MTVHNIEPLGLQHRPELDPLLRGAACTLSEYSFANLYLFRQRHRYELCRGTSLFVRGVSYDGRSFAMPAADMRTLSDAAVEEMLSSADMLFPVPEEHLSRFAGPEFSIACDDGDSDYIYPTGRICTFGGKKMHGKRNLLNQFVSQYEHEGRPLTADLVPAALDILDRWQAESGSRPEETDYRACREALELADMLGLCGGIYYAGGKPAGFIVGEELGHEMFALHFAKALTAFKGIYQFIFSSFACILPGSYRWLNFEQDLGIEGLRSSKRSYVPEFMQRKYRISRPQNWGDRPK